MYKTRNNNKKAVHVIGLFLSWQAGQSFPHICIQECTSPLFLSLLGSVGSGNRRIEGDTQGGPAGWSPKNAADSFYRGACWVLLILGERLLMG